MAERGFVRGLYVADDGTAWSLAVDRDSVAAGDRGWSIVTDPATPQLPRGWLPRRVVGIDPTGRQQTTRVATTEAPLWTGVSSQWEVEASDGTLVTAIVVARQQERVIASGRLDPN